MRQVGVALAVCLLANTFAAGKGNDAPCSTQSKKSSSEAVAVCLSEMQKAIEAQQEQIQRLGITRVLIEGSFGIGFKACDGSREKVNRGRIQWGPQFSCVDRNTWSGMGGEPHGLDAMIFSSFRYHLP